jgi:hypothetical protein
MDVIFLYSLCRAKHVYRAYVIEIGTVSTYYVKSSSPEFPTVENLDFYPNLQSVKVVNLAFNVVLV